MTTPTGDAPIVTFRDTLRAICPPWLQGGIAEKLLYSMAVQLDSMGDALVAGVKIRFPNVYTDESLALLGVERRIRRGQVEDAATYTPRLQRWLTDHQRRGGPYAMLEQVYAHYKPNNFPIVLLYRSGRRFQMDVSGNITRDTVPTLPNAAWAKWTMVYFSDAFTIADAPDVALVPREWIAAHCIGDVVILPTGGELWDYPLGHVWDEPGVWDTAIPPVQVVIIGT